MVVIEDGYVKIVWTEELKYHPLNRRNKMAEKYIHKPGKGSFINNKYKNKDSQPDYTGDCTLPDTDIMEWDDQGNIKVKASKDIPAHALQAIKSIKTVTKTDKDGNSYTTIEIEMWDKVGVLRILAKASGLLDNPEESDKPSVLGINIRAPEVIDHGESTEETGSDQSNT